MLVRAPNVVPTKAFTLNTSGGVVVLNGVFVDGMALVLSATSGAAQFTTTGTQIYGPLTLQSNTAAPLTQVAAKSVPLGQ